MKLRRNMLKKYDTERKDYTQLPDGEWILAEVLLDFKVKYPETYHLLVTQGASAVGF